MFTREPWRWVMAIALGLSLAAITHPSRMLGWIVLGLWAVIVATTIAGAVSLLLEIRRRNRGEWP